MQKYDLEQSQTKVMPMDAWVTAFAKAGKKLSFYLSSRSNNQELTPSDHMIAENLDKAQQRNPWFTEDDLQFCLKNWAELLTEEKLRAWLKRYDLTEAGGKTVALIPAGNIPLVGLHDLLCILLTGNKALIKLSGSDDILPRMVLKLADPDNKLSKYYHFTDSQLTNYDAVIATGSDNTARYFHYYFKDKPSVIRHNRNSVAVLTGDESKEDLEQLGDDIFRYFGLGCRSISHLMVPADYDFDPFFQAMYSREEIINHQKYQNNYDYNKAVYLMSEFDLLDNGFLVLKKEDEKLGSPIATLGYRNYQNTAEVQNLFKNQGENIQCIAVSDPRSKVWQEIEISGGAPAMVRFGETQSPSLTDYADGVDVMKFLSSL